MSVSPNELNQALVDVRLAYRLLHDYQRAAMDAADYIGNQLGYRYTGGYGRFSKMLEIGKGSLQDWAWDTLNMLLFEFNFSPKVAKPGNVDFLIWLASDTGYFESDDPGVLQTDPRTFKVADLSGTKIAFLLYRDWKDEFSQVFQFDEENRLEWRRLFKSGIVPKYFAGADVFAKVYDFSSVADEQSTDALIDDLIQSAYAKGFVLGRTGKTS